MGDAAIAFYPLSSHGITNALYTAQKAADAIETYLTIPGEEPLKAYEETLNALFIQYLADCSRFYKTEKRWPDGSFWKSVV